MSSGSGQRGRFCQPFSLAALYNLFAVSPLQLLGFALSYAQLKPVPCK